MTRYFFDTSALLKRYIAERGTGWVRSIVAPGVGNTILIAQITPVELVSAASRRRRDGQISARTARATRLLIDRHMSREYNIVGLTGAVTRHAEDLLEAHPLRAYDAVQLASALGANTRLLAISSPPLIFVSSDTRLLVAATDEGLPTDDPNLRP